ncbi:MAG: hypothetical protein KAX49_12130 [Halanaerobiales bacterium]|nr:hypothetical protein [Halanaerobiales bacterium]
MGIIQFFKKLFGGEKEKTNEEELKKVVKLGGESYLFKEVSEEKGDNQINLTFGSKDLMQMAVKLKNKGELFRAEQLLRDGVYEDINNAELWWLLFGIAEPLNRLGRAYFCIEQIIRLEPENEFAKEKIIELKSLVDKHLNYFVEYKMAPEFYKLK